jgi:hypothetical protein
MVPTFARAMNPIVENRGRSWSVKVPPMVVMLADPRVVKAVTLETSKSPVISCGPSRKIAPVADDDMRTVPNIVAQLIKEFASAWEPIVTVA